MERDDEAEAPTFAPRELARARDEGEDDEFDEQDPRRAGFRARVEDMKPLTRRAAAARLHVTPGTIKRWEKEGKIHPTRKDGKPWYDPEEVEELAEEHDGEEVGQAQLLGQAGKIIQQQMSHNQSILDTYVTTTSTLLQMAMEQVKHLQAQKNELEEKLWKSRALIDQAQTQETQRNIMGMEAASKQARNEKLLDAAMSMAPTVMALVAKKMGADTGTAIDPALRALMESLTMEQMGNIFAANVLTQEQIAAFITVYKMMQPEKAAEAAAAVNG